MSRFDPLLPRRSVRDLSGEFHRIPAEARRSILAEDYSLAGVCAYLRALRLSRPPRVVVLAGAGISTSAGIKDFRSSTGMYADDQTKNLFSMEFLLANPADFYLRVKEMFLPVVDGVIRPTK